MESPDNSTYLESPMEGDDVAYPCKGCGDILEEGKAFELAGNRWHLNCFRCNTCGTLLDSDANLLLLGDGSLICNNCTYSCSACNNKIEDLAILTGDQAFCATCFRCRNCKRKIENLRYARTSQGIFCMSCHESLMARRRKKSRAAANAKKKDDQSPMLVDKSLPALPPNAVPQSAFSPEREIPDPHNADNPTELSPRPRPTYSRTDSSSRSSSRKPRDDTSSHRASTDTTGRDGLTLPTTTYRNNRYSGISQMSEIGNGDGESFFIPLALDPSPAPTLTPRSTSTSWDTKKAKENQAPDRDYFGAKDNMRSQTEPQSQRRSRDLRDASSTSTPHIAFQDKNQPSDEQLAQIKDSIRRAANGTGTPAKESSASTSDDTLLQHASSPTADAPDGKTQGSSEKFRPDHVQILTGITTKGHGKFYYFKSQFWKFQSLHTRKEIASGPVKSHVSTMSLSSGTETSPSTESSSEGTAHTPTVNGKSISGPLLQSPIDDMVPPNRSSTRPPIPKQQLSDTYMTPRAPPAPPSAGSNGTASSPNLPRWSAGGDLTMDEDMARIFGNDEGSQSIIRRVSNAVRHVRNTSSEASTSARGHGRSVSETTARTPNSPRWPKTPIIEDTSGPRDISSPISISSPNPGDDPALLRRQLRNSEQRVAELERQFVNEKDLKTLNKKLIEKRKTVSVLDSQTELMIRQLEVLAGYVERAKGSKQPLDIAELEDSAIKEFVQKLDRLKQSMSGAIEQLFEERDELLEEKNQAIADRDRALVEFEQLSSKNAQLADMNNDLTHQIQERFKSANTNMESPRPSTNGLGIYTHHNKDKSNVSVHLDNAILRPSESSSITYNNSINSYPHPMEQDPSMEPATLLSAPHVVNIRKGQAKKFNWKKGGQTVAKGVTKGFKGAFSSGQERPLNQWPGQTGDNIGMPYNMTMEHVQSPAPNASGANLPRSTSNDPSRQGFGLFKKSQSMPKSMSSGNILAAESPSTLFGSDLVERADYERRQIPSVVTRCIEEVELRGMDIEGIYRKTGGTGQVNIIKEGFDKTEDYDISDPDLDITAVTSVLKQYFRKLPVPLLTFDVYDRVLESISIEDNAERCTHLRNTVNMLPPKHRDCLEFLIFHLVRVAKRESENLMTPKNLAVVFAPTIMRDHSIDREMTDMHAKNQAVQFVIENSYDIFAGA
ncbi:putative rho-type gtpase-activating protein [Botrytis fragariae]|uniref:Putative rho-type gtpase-activating protein n=1 Tax=Botrytis fragariae TaxID=1964551 RepID=A0A8H6AVP7_9HELO|nr:putative rho-type gtpase-activating protein [Botrytis fragariae]KAF5874643.1 putative rho-type gtpase-activating protein [Botrytis fragariae]